MQLHSVACAIAVVLLASGCLSPGTDPHAPPSTPTATSFSQSETNGTSQPRISIPQEPIDDLILTDCVRGDGFSDYPGPLSPGTRPEGWQPRSPEDISTLGVKLFVCNRVFIGGFERGPVHLLFEGHGNASYPEACAANLQGATDFDVLSNVLVDDTELATYLSTTYGMNIRMAEFHLSSQDAGPSAFRTFSWAVDGGPESHITVLDNQEDIAKPTFYERYFWTHGSQLVSLELDNDKRGSKGDWPANGTLHPPMLLASDTGGTFVGFGAWFSSFEARGAFTRFTDYFCTTKAP